MRTFFFILNVFLPVLILAQTNLSGIVISKSGQALENANIEIVGTNEGSTTNALGYFNFETPLKRGKIQIYYLGFQTYVLSFEHSVDFGQIVLSEVETPIPEVLIFVNTDLVLSRKSPITISNLNAQAIENDLGTKELPELLNTTPSVYATKAGGGFGDARINIRGFDQKNISVLLNGIPLNDMENSWLYWSNLAGIENVTSDIQIQRGLGLTKLAVSSVGGTINIITQSSLKEEGGYVALGLGNDKYLKTHLSYNTGVLENGFSSSISLGRQSSDGYIDGTAFESYQYFMSFGWQKPSGHLQLTLLGAPQNHGQRVNSYFNMATIKDHLKYGLKYNYNYGLLNGKDYKWTENYYHKPIISLNWTKLFSNNAKLNTSFYTSFGRGGGTSDLGKLPGQNNFASSTIFRDENGLVRFDDIVAYNSGEAVVFSDGSTYQRDPNSEGMYINSFRNAGLSRRAFTNSHQWYGIISDFNYSFNDYIKAGIGVDLRYSKGTNYVRLNNLLGADAYFDFFDRNQPVHTVSTTYDTSISSVWNVFRDTEKDEKIFFHADGLVKWGGLFGHISYNKDKINTFFQAAFSDQLFKRNDYFNYLSSDPQQSTDWISIFGGNVKAGINYTLNSQSQIYYNAGFYSKQPGFEVVFLDFNNTINEAYKNEKVFSTELGYGFQNDKFSLKANVYLTKWTDRFISIDYVDAVQDIQGSAKILNLGQIHKGLEFETIYKPIQNLSLKGMLSIGDWRYANDVSGVAFDTENQALGDVYLNLKNVKVPDAAQFTALLGLNYQIGKNLQFNIHQFYADQLYAAIAPDDNWENHDTALKLPAYSLIDTRMSYKLLLTNTYIKALLLNFSIDNLFNETYISESSTNYPLATNPSDNWKGINTANKVFFGFGRTYRMNLNIKF